MSLWLQRLMGNVVVDGESRDVNLQIAKRDTTNEYLFSISLEGQQYLLFVVFIRFLVLNSLTKST